jgi:ABC-type uncharacterized transport system ATPase subunit
MSDQELVIETRGLTKRFGGVEAVRDVDFAVKAGELRCLIGPNGAGKSTFFKLLTGQLKPSAGRVFHRGVDVTNARSHEIARRGIGMKTQVPSLFEQLSVHENISLAAVYKNPPAQAQVVVDETLERLRLSADFDRPVSELSHGQRQWVELGIVLAGDPELVLLDEPTAGLSREEVAETAELVREINRTRTLIVVEHDMQFIRMIATTVTVFHQGSILIEAPAEEVMQDQRVHDVYLGKRQA